MINLAMKKKQSKIDQSLARIEDERRRILEDAKREAREILNDARNTSKSVQKELNKLSLNQSLGERNKIIQEGRRQIGVAEKALATPLVRKVNTEPVSAEELKEGMRVKLLTMDQNGTVIDLPDSKQELLVQVGAIKVKAKLSDIAIIVDGSEPKTKSSRRILRSTHSGRAAKTSLYSSKAMQISPKIDVRGLNLEEAIMRVEKHIDDAFIAGLDKTTVVHGRGEGILRDGIRRKLRSNKHVASLEKPAYNEGGEGATIVVIKKNA